MGPSGGTWGVRGGVRSVLGYPKAGGYPDTGVLLPLQVFQPPVTLPPGGRFYPPTLITGVAPTSRCLRELVGTGGGGAQKQLRQRQKEEGVAQTARGWGLQGRGLVGVQAGGLLTCACPRQVPGPVLVLLPVRSPGEAVTVASGLPHVAAGAVWAQDVTLALDTADR